MNDLKDILHEDDGVKNDDLLRYLEGTASDEERFTIEKQMADSDFMNDAVEGLQKFQDKQQLQQYVAQLKTQLRKQTSKDHKRKRRISLNSQQWTMITIVTIILLCVLAYWVIRLYQLKV